MVSAKLIQKAGGSFDLGNAQVHYERCVPAFLITFLITNSFILSKLYGVRNLPLVIFDLA